MSNTYDYDSATGQTAAEVIRDLAQETVAPVELEPGVIYAFAFGNQVHRVDLTGDEYLDEPKRKRGTVTVTDVDSFVTYYEKHADPDTEVYADQAQNQVTAILDAHRPTVARFGQHRLMLQLKHSQSFLDWYTKSSNPFGQVAFAEWIEDHLPDIVSPSGAELLEIAQTFHATSKTAFKSGTILSSGQRQLVWDETVAATAGAAGKLTIPEAFTLGLEIYEGVRNAEGKRVLDQLTARLRYRINNGDLSMIYVLNRPADAVRAAFDAVTAAIQTNIEKHVLRGAPITS